MSEQGKKIHLLGQVSFVISKLSTEQLEAVLAFVDFLKKHAEQPKDDF